MKLLPANLFGSLNEGERIVREIISAQLQKLHGYALHSVGLSEHDYKVYAEADFLIICEHGVACLEVKGGDVVRRKDGIWEIGSKSKNKYYQSSEGPFKQAQSASSAVVSEISRNGSIFAPVVWGVVFPHIPFPTIDPEWREYQVCDNSKIDRFEDFLKTLFSESKKHLKAKGLRIELAKKYSSSEMERLKNILRKDIHISWSNGNIIKESITDLKVLESHQETVLDELIFGQNPRMLLKGSAGTGKTLLAIKAAQSFEKRGLKVLFLVFNKLLASQLKKLFTGTNVDVFTINRFMLNFCGIRSPKNPDDKFYWELLPSLFYDMVIEKGMEEQLDLYDFLVCDEAQDFLREDIGRGIFDLLRDGAKKGQWLICIDEEIQSEVYGNYSPDYLARLESQSGCLSRDLFRNFRNPKQIASWANNLFPDKELAIPSRNFDAVPKFETFLTSKDELKKLHEVVLNFISTGVQPEQITILTFAAKNKSKLNQLSSTGGKRLISGNFESSNVINWFQMGAFKGLENEIVIIIEVPDDVMTSRRPEYFVGLTRARSGVIVICSKESRAWEF